MDLDAKPMIGSNNANYREFSRRVSFCGENLRSWEAWGMVARDGKE